MTVAEYAPLGLTLPQGDIWVFGYGSLMWNPDFPFLCASKALLRGYHRTLCVYSTRYRGTPERPGLVLGLDRGGSCRGMAFRIAADQAAPVLTHLWTREMGNRTYHPKWLQVSLPGEKVRALAFVADRTHCNYAAGLSGEQSARLILGAVGGRGPNVDYLRNTVAHLDELGMHDRYLAQILAYVLQHGG